MLQKDTPKHQGMRKKLVEELMKKGISDEKVLSAIGKVPRHLFLDSSFESHAYQNKAFPIGAEQTISQKATVYSIERQNELFKITKKLLPKLNYFPKKLIFGDGYKGLSNQAPFDSIIVTAGAPYVPKDLMSQLKIGGRLVIPVGSDPQVMHLYIRKDEKKFSKQEFGEFRFVPLLERKN